ncbi:MAG: NAD(P)-dependent oxidoreductase [Kiritimatiellae bacterium]|nr:NAD(P)-dependent oxidoreductase [Kiritimatiellia bacterium]
MKTILITGATGRLAASLRRHWAGRHTLRLLSLTRDGDPAVQEADLRVWDPRWTTLFEGVDAVVHNAALQGVRDWGALLPANIDGTVFVFEAAVRAGVKRVIFASTNHVMGGYKDGAQTAIAADTPPRPGMVMATEDGGVRSTVGYGATKAAGERIGKCYADMHGLSVIAVRIGSCRWTPETADPHRIPWLKAMWLSERDYCHLMDCCIGADPALRFAIVNGMSNNTGMPWRLDEARRLLGYEPRDDVAQTEWAR